jgi:hypothetical protein
MEAECADRAKETGGVLAPRTVPRDRFSTLGIGG